MTDHEKALDALIEAVEAGTCPLRLITDAGYSSSPVKAAIITRAAYNGSLDAAVSLKDALLPGWEWGVTYNHENTKCAAYVAEWGAQDEDQGKMAENDTPARALLLAILTAYRHTLETRV